ncbi:hypothetical protein OUZ56_016343 [Daphnia magna]|uniref:Uncharacterized protein n=1 Tax=Daphnia magna TaxID=35525 RepID=A0ABR0AQE4_9CRUS|nr:hypothetical protein OUZ56_016343 [Daphnia magna]
MLLDESSGQASQANEIHTLEEPPDQLLTADGTEWLVVDSGNEDEEIIPSSPKVPDPPPNTQPIPAFKQRSITTDVEGIGSAITEDNYQTKNYH